MSAVQSQKPAWNLAQIAEFIAKSGCMHVRCGTYIPIILCTGLHQYHSLNQNRFTSISQPCDPGNKIGGFRNQNS